MNHCVCLQSLRSPPICCSDEGDRGRGYGGPSPGCPVGVSEWGSRPPSFHGPTWGLWGPSHFQQGWGQGSQEPGPSPPPVWVPPAAGSGDPSLRVLQLWPPAQQDAPMPHRTTCCTLSRLPPGSTAGQSGKDSPVRLGTRPLGSTAPHPSAAHLSRTPQTPAAAHFSKRGIGRMETPGPPDPRASGTSQGPRTRPPYRIPSAPQVPASPACHLPRLSPRLGAHSPCQVPDASAWNALPEPQMPSGLCSATSKKLPASPCTAGPSPHRTPSLPHCPPTCTLSVYSSGVPLPPYMSPSRPGTWCMRRFDVATLLGPWDRKAGARHPLSERTKPLTSPQFSSPFLLSPSTAQGPGRGSGRTAHTGFRATPGRMAGWLGAAGGGGTLGGLLAPWVWSAVHPAEAPRAGP